MACSAAARYSQAMDTGPSRLGIGRSRTCCAAWDTARTWVSSLRSRSCRARAATTKLETASRAPMWTARIGDRSRVSCVSMTTVAAQASSAMPTVNRTRANATVNVGAATSRGERWTTMGTKEAASVIAAISETAVPLCTVAGCRRRAAGAESASKMPSLNTGNPGPVLYESGACAVRRPVKGRVEVHGRSCGSYGPPYMVWGQDPLPYEATRLGITAARRAQPTTSLPNRGIHAPLCGPLCDSDPAASRTGTTVLDRRVTERESLVAPGESVSSAGALTTLRIRHSSRREARGHVSHSDGEVPPEGRGR